MRGSFPRPEQKRPFTAPPFRRAGEACQKSSLDEQEQEKNVGVEGNQPLSRPARLGTAPPRTTLCPGRVHFARSFAPGRPRKERPTPDPLSADGGSQVSGPLFSSTFPDRSLRFCLHQGRRGRACPTLAAIGETPMRPEDRGPSGVPAWCGRPARCRTGVPPVRGNGTLPRLRARCPQDRGRDARATRAGTGGKAGKV